jgi:hypothetical protein
MADSPAVTVGLYWVTDYESKPCEYKALKHCGALADGFGGAMRSRGHTPAVRRFNGAASPRQWRLATDSDPGGVDTVEFAFLASHGATHGQERAGAHVHWVKALFNAKDDSPQEQPCWWSTVELGGGRSGEEPPKRKKPDGSYEDPVVAMCLGDGSLHWVVLDFCRSLQVRLDNEVFKQDNEDENAARRRRDALREAHPHLSWIRCWAGVHMMFGFTGRSSDAGWTATRGQAFGRRAAAGEPLAEGWLDEAHSSVCDDAPVVIAWGRSEEDAMRRLKAESLASPEPDLPRNPKPASAIMWRAESLAE